MDIVKHIEEIVRFSKRSLLAGVLVSVIGMFLFQVLGPKILEDILRRDLILYSIEIILALVVVFWISFVQDTKKKKLGANPIGTELKNQYKGLIVSISALGDPKKVQKNIVSLKDRNKPEYFTIDEIKEKIESIDLRSTNSQQELEYLYTLQGIGQTFKAIFHHHRTLQCVWLIYTDRSETTGALELVKKLIGKIDDKISVQELKIDDIDINKIETVYRSINKIYIESIKDKGLTEKDVIADITGGTALMSCAMVLACLSPERDLEYVEQKNYTMMKIEEKIGDIILKK